MDMDIDKDMFRQCKLDKTDYPSDTELFEPVACTENVRLTAEDEISLDSIFSHLLSFIPQDQKTLRKCDWDLKPKDLHNDKQSMLFEDKLWISKLKNANCKMQEKVKVFLERELEQVGYFTFSVEESYDGYVTYSSSKMDQGKAKCGHKSKGKYDDKFVIICEKRIEFKTTDATKMENVLEVRNKEDLRLMCMRANKCNGEIQKYKTEINIKDREDLFVLDCGIMLLMRYLVMSNFMGAFEYYTMNMFGKVLRCVLTVQEERQNLRIFYMGFENVKVIINEQYFNNELQDSSETYFCCITGKIVLHYWRGYNYILHQTKKPVPLPDPILPTMELMWKKDRIMYQRYEDNKKLNYENAMNYLRTNVAALDMLQDYLIHIIKFKPTNVLDFTIKYFLNFQTHW